MSNGKLINKWYYISIHNENCDCETTCRENYVRMWSNYILYIFHVYIAWIDKMRLELHGRIITSLSNSGVFKYYNVAVIIMFMKDITMCCNNFD